MKIVKIQSVYSNQKQNNQSSTPVAFGNFVKVVITESEIKSINSYHFKKVAQEASEIAQNLADKIKTITGGKVNIYKRKLTGMGFRAKYANAAYNLQARTLLLEDNNGANVSELMKAVEYLTKDRKINSEIYAGDLFAPRKKGFVGSLLGSPLEYHAYGATVKDLDKL